MKKTIYLLGIIFLSALKGYSAKQIVSAQGTSFTPSNFTINLGDTIVWQRTGGTHTTTSLGIPPGAVAWNAPLNATTTSFTYVPAVAGTYNYKCTPHASFGMVGSFTVTGCPPVSGQVSASGPTTVCKPLSVSLTCNATAGASIQWQKNGTNISGATGSSYNATATGNYRVHLSNNCGSTFNTNAIAVTVNAQPMATITSTGPTTYCKGTTPLTLTANSGAFTYKWKKGATYISGATGMNYHPTATDTYKVEVTNGNGCSKLSAGVAVTVKATPMATITPLGPTTFCAGGSVVLMANGGTGLTYQWKKGNNLINGATSQNFTATQAGTYKVIVTKANNCSKTSAGTVVTINCRETGELLSPEFAMELNPNPASQQINLSFVSEDNAATIQIVSIAGQVLVQKEIKNSDNNFEESIDISKLPAGVYAMLVKTNSGSARRMFVKE